MNLQPGALLPEIWLLAGALAVLLTGSFLPRRRLGWVRAATLVVLGGSAASAALALAQPARTVFEGSYTVDAATGAVRLISVLATALVILLAGDELTGHVRQAEICTLLLLATSGTIVLGGANDLLLVITGFLLASVPLYALIGLTRTPVAAEAALKTYFLASLFGIVLMVGVVMLYGLGVTTNYPELRAALIGAPTGPLVAATVALLGGLMFKVGAVPGHFWVPDAAQGSSAFAAAFLTTVPKIGALVAAYRIVTTLPAQAQAPLLIGILAVVSMTLGNLAAYGQRDPRRLLGWSTVSQAGYLLVPVAVAGRSELALPSLLFYLTAYAVTNIAAFAVIAALPGRRTLAEYNGLSTTQPRLAAALTVSLLGLVGTPPTAVFVGKLAVASAAWDSNAAWLTVALLINSVISLFYYLRWIAQLLKTGRPITAARRTGAAVAIGSAITSLILGLTAAAVWQLFTAT